jgi:serine/threonine protein phosphatase 1
MLRFLTGRINRRAASQPVAVARVPDDVLVCAIGDIHGRLDLLTNLEDQIVRFAADRSETVRRIVCLGDYIDRGYASREVIDHLRGRAPDGFERICLIGNHEDYLLRYFESAADGPPWLANGGRETLMSYGVTLPAGLASPEDIARAREDLMARLPDGHLDFLRSLAAYHVEGDYLFVHAGVQPGVPLSAQQSEDLFWIRESFLGSDADHGYVVVHGHTVVEEPEVRANRIGIDTGAYASGRLTALALAGDTRTFLRT